MRDYKKEAAWNKAHYTNLRAFIDKPLGDKFIATLKQRDIKYTDWLRDRINEYLYNNPN